MQRKILVFKLSLKHLLLLNMELNFLNINLIISQLDMYLLLHPLPFQAWQAADCALRSGVKAIFPPTLQSPRLFDPYYTPCM